MPPTPEPSSPSRRWIALACLLAIGLAGLRGVHLGADTPPYVSTWSDGLYVDEGYKTLSARNLVELGTDRWNPGDDYLGWLGRSPITQGLFYLSFWAFEPGIEAARLVNVALFAVLLVSFVLMLGPRYPPALLLAGLLALGLEGTLFYFSRVALFEPVLILPLYLLLFVFARAEHGATLKKVLLALLVCSLATLTIKRSAALYAFPILFALAAIYLRAGPGAVRPWVWVAAIGGVAGLALATTNVWLWRVDLDPLGYVQRVLNAPTVGYISFVVVPAWLAALHGLLVRPDLFFGNAYRLSLVALVVLIPLELAVFQYHPLRYYVPMFPAHVLLVLEWAHLKLWREPIPQRVAPPVAGLAVAALTVALYYLAKAGNRILLASIPIDLGDAPGLSDRSMLLLFGPLAAGAAPVLWWFRSRWATPHTLRQLGAALAALFAVHSLAVVASFWWTARYEAREVRAALVREVAPGRSVGGDWAPFLTLGTGIRTLYMNDLVNPPPRIQEVAPDFLLASDKPSNQLYLEQVSGVAGVTLGPARPLGSYHGRSVSLYPLAYRGASRDGSGRSE